MMFHIKNAQIFDGEGFKKDKIILISNEKIIDIISTQKAISKEFSQGIDAKGCVVAPGFIDIQVNGGGGVFFNESPSIQSIIQIMDTHLKYGTTSLLPTLITDKEIKTKMAINAIEECFTKKISGILGLHLEGPVINSNKSGIHTKKAIRNFTNKELKNICSPRSGIILVTLAPEQVNAKLIRKLVNNNIVVFAGHTDATYEKMMQSFSHGISGITHLFNACSPLQSREAGVVGAGLYHNESWCGIIADGFHVSYDTIRLALKAKSSKKFILVSDAMPPVGTKLKSFFIAENKIFVKNGKCTSADGTLAGSMITVYDAFKNILSNKIVSLSEALQMTSTNAAECLGIDKENRTEFKKGRVLPAYDADLVIFSEKTLQIKHVIQGGKIF